MRLPRPMWNYYYGAQLRQGKANVAWCMCISNIPFVTFLTFLRDTDTHCLQTTLSLFLSITLRESELSIKGLCFMDSYFVSPSNIKLTTMCIKSLVLHVRCFIHIYVSECCLHPPVAAAYNPQKQQPVPD